MTVERARGILGEFAKHLSNQEIQAIIDCFNGIIEVGLRQFEREYKVESRPEVTENEVAVATR